MREIKFRGKNGKGKWITGDLLHNRGETFIAPPGIANPLATLDDFRIDPATVGQFTGLHDAEGKEIYEGDIFQVKAYEPKYEVCFNKAGFEYRQIGGTNKYFPLKRIYSDTYILGNRWDNPELLKGGEQ